MIGREELFDALAVRLGQPQTRTQAVKLLGAGALALTPLPVVTRGGSAQDVTDESQLIKGCKLPGQKCNNGKQDCCTRKCKNSVGRCGCINKGSKPLFNTPLGPVPVKALCCSNKINKRTEECK